MDSVATAWLSEPARGFSVLATDGDQSPPVNFQAGMQQPGILQPAEADSPSIGRRRFTEEAAQPLYAPVVRIEVRLSENEDLYPSSRPVVRN